MRLTSKTLVSVVERGKRRVKQLGKTLPPKRWIAKMKKKIKPDAINPTAVIGKIWWSLSAKRKWEILKRYHKGKRIIRRRRR